MQSWMNAHPSAGKLRAYLDGAHPAARLQQIQLHLAACPRCRTRLAELEATAAVSATAVTRLQAAVELVPAPLSPPKEAFPMLLPLWRRALPHTAAGLVLAVMVSAVALPPVRSVAAQWLSVFRTEKIATVQLDDRQLDSAVRSTGRLTPELARQLGDVTGPQRLPEPVSVSLAEAGALAGGLHDPKLPADLAAATPEVWGLRPATYYVRPDVDKTNAWLQSQNVPARLSDQLRGQTIKVVTPSLGIRLWGKRDGSGPAFVLAEGTGPQVTGTAALDLQRLVDVVAGIAGVPANVTAQIKQIPDLQNTLVLPVTPTQGEPVAVGGVRGYLYSAPQGKSRAVVWTVGGKVYVAAGTLSRDELLQAVAW